MEPSVRETPGTNREEDKNEGDREGGGEKDTQVQGPGIAKRYVDVVKTPYRTRGGPLPPDRKINATMGEVRARTQNRDMRCYRYRVEGGFRDEEDAQVWMNAVTAKERERLRIFGGDELKEIQDGPFMRIGVTEPWMRLGKQHGAQMYRMWANFEDGKAPKFDDVGQGGVTVGAELRQYQWFPQPLARRMGSKSAGGVWGAQDKGVTFDDREDWASQHVGKLLDDIAGNPQGGMLPAVQCRSIATPGQVGMDNKKYMMTICFRNAVHLTQLMQSEVKQKAEELGMQMLTQEEYMQRLEAMGSAWNADSGAQEQGLDGRKYMVWHLPSTADVEKLRKMLNNWFSEENQRQGWLEEEKVQVVRSRYGKLYGWYVLDSAGSDRRMGAEGFIHRLQSVPGYGACNQSVSRTRYARVQDKAAWREQQQAREDVATRKVPKVVVVPTGIGPGTEQEKEFYDKVQNKFTEMGKRVVDQVQKAMEPVVKALEAAPAELRVATKPLKEVTGRLEGIEHALKQQMERHEVDRKQ